MSTTIMRTLLAGAAVASLLGLALPTIVTATNTPTVTIASSAPDPTSDKPIFFTVTLSTSSSAFTSSALTVSGGSVVNFAGSGSSYSFGIVPGDGDPLHASQPRLVSVQVMPNTFDGNVGSNYISRWFDPAAASSSASVASSTSSSTSTSTSTTASITSSSTTASTSSTSTGGGGTVSTAGGGGNGEPVGSSPTAPSSGTGNGSIAGGPPPGHAIIPGGSLGSTPGVPNTGGSQAALPASVLTHTVVPIASEPAVITGTGTSGSGSVSSKTTSKTSSTASSRSSSPTISRSSGGSALVAANTPGVPNTGSVDQNSTNTASASQAYGSTSSSTPGIPNTGSSDGVPGWVWLVLAGIVLIAIGIWALRQPVV